MRIVKAGEMPKMHVRCGTCGSYLELVPTDIVVNKFIEDARMIERPTFECKGCGMVNRVAEIDLPFSIHPVGRLYELDEADA